MGFVYIAAGVFKLLSPRRSNNDFPAIWDTELLFVPRVDKSDALFCSGNVLIKPFLHIAVTVKIIVAPCGIAAEQELSLIHIFAAISATFSFSRTFPDRYSSAVTYRTGSEDVYKRQP